MCLSERKVGLSEIKQRVSVLHVPCLKTGCDHLGHEEVDLMKEGSEQVAERESKSCFPRLVIQMPFSLATVNLTLLHS